MKMAAKSERGIWLRKLVLTMWGLICFLPILIVYYPLLAVSVDKAKDGFFPPYSVWLGNIVLGAAGIWMLRRENRH